MTMIVIWVVCSRVGQWTFFSSESDSRKKVVVGAR